MLGDFEFGQLATSLFRNTIVCSSPDQDDCNIRYSDGTKEAWTQTFLREAEKGRNSDCTVIDGSGSSPCNNVFEASNIEAAATTMLERSRFRYVPYNIYQINAFFASWYTAINTVIPEATSTIDDIIRLIDKEHKSYFNRDNILTVLGIGLSFIPVIGPEAAGLSVAAVKGINLVLSGIQKAPGIAQQLWPAGSEDTIPFQIDQLSNEFERDILPGLRTNLQNGLRLIQGVGQENVSSFLALAGDGAFSASTNSSPTVLAPMDAQIQPLSVAFTTFLVSTAISQNGGHALMLPGVDPAGIANGTAGYPSWAGDHSEEDDLQCTGYNDNGQCEGTYWWYSKNHNSAYTLSLGDGSPSTDVINATLSGKWSTGALLFENAAICEIQSMLRAALPQSGDSVNYTTFAGKAGFSYEGDIPDLHDFITPLAGSTTINFIAIDSGGFPNLSKVQSYSDLLHHPDNASFWSIDADGFDFSCTSQLNVSIANSWGGSWLENSPES